MTAVFDTEIVTTTLVVTGSRSGALTEEDIAYLDDVRSRWNIVKVFHGNAPGIDTAVGEWAASRGVPVRRFIANWAAHGRTAGPMRNMQMAEAAAEAGNAIVLVFPGGKGTRSMADCCRKLRLPMVFRDLKQEKEMMKRWLKK